MTLSRYLAEARTITNLVGSVLEQRGLQPVIRQALLTETEFGDTLLFVVLDDRQLGRLEPYTSPELLHQLSTRLRGKPVALSNHTGLRYGIQLNHPRPFPVRVNFPGCVSGQILIGLRRDGRPSQVSWEDAHHILVAGMTGSGKSVFLRSVVYQATADGASLLLGDLDGSTFPMFASNPALNAPIAATPQAVLEIVQMALGECEHRAMLYSSAPGFPETLEQYNRSAVKEGQSPLPRFLVVLDEFSAMAAALGGAKGNFCSQVAALGWRGRKFGITLVIAAQDFTKGLIGPVRDQFGLAVCFRVRSFETARAIGCPSAVKISARHPGRAVTDHDGWLQTYYLDKASIGQPTSLLANDNFDLARRALTECDGYISIPVLKRWGLREREARSLLDSWEQRGWVQRDPARANSRKITAKLLAILSNRQSGQTCQTD